MVQMMVGLHTTTSRVDVLHKLCVTPDGRVVAPKLIQKSPRYCGHHPSKTVKIKMKSHCFCIRLQKGLFAKKRQMAINSNGQKRIFSELMAFKKYLKAFKIWGTKLKQFGRAITKTTLQYKFATFCWYRRQPILQQNCMKYDLILKIHIWYWQQCKLDFVLFLATRYDKRNLNYNSLEKQPDTVTN